MKRVMCFIAALLLIAALPIGALAETWTGVDFTFEAPEGLYQLGPNLEETDPAWALAGVGDAAGKLEEYREMGVLVNFLSQDGATNISVMQKESEEGQQIFDLRLMEEEDKAKFLDSLVKAGEDNVAVDKGWFENKAGLLFYRVKIDVSGEQEMHEVIYGTIMNGYSLNIDIHTIGAAMTPEQEELVRQMADTMVFTNTKEKPPEDYSKAINTLLLMVLMLAAVAGPIIYVPIKGRRDKKKKAKLAEQLSEFHKVNGKDTAYGEAAFVNETDCTREAIRRFSFYQAYVKNIGEVVFGALLCVVTVCAAFLIDSVWWIKLAAVAVTVYYAYKLIGMQGAVEKIQIKVHSQGTSQTAHYAFYPDVFRVSGIQSANVVPYFQIVDIRKCGQYLYLYYGPDNAYLVDTYGFKLGESGDFEKFIREKMQKQ